MSEFVEHIMGRNILKSMLQVSEKAANIARAIRQEDHLLSLLIREKAEHERNPRFNHDFKTLADVLIQEVVKHDLGLEFPSLIGRIFGEETNEFLCSDGQTVSVIVGQSEAETKDLLERILGDERAAASLAQLVHSTSSTETSNLPSINLDLNDLGIWIDPIDSTTQYIAGGSLCRMEEGIITCGLQCVTVLIGAFSLQTGLPLLGVINQPFHEKENERWLGKIFWGVNQNDQKVFSIPDVELFTERKVVLVSSSESEEIKSRLARGGFLVIESAGAGHKLLCVATGMAAAYVLTKPSTFYWDTCGVQALLTAQKGGVVSYQQACKGIIEPLKVTQGGTDQCCNNEGLIAYREPNVLKVVVNNLTQ